MKIAFSFMALIATCSGADSVLKIVDGLSGCCGYESGQPGGDRIWSFGNGNMPNRWPTPYEKCKCSRSHKGKVSEDGTEFTFEFSKGPGHDEAAAIKLNMPVPKGATVTVLAHGEASKCGNAWGWSEDGENWIRDEVYRTDYSETPRPDNGCTGSMCSNPQKGGQWTHFPPIPHSVGTLLTAPEGIQYFAISQGCSVKVTSITVKCTKGCVTTSTTTATTTSATTTTTSVTTNTILQELQRSASKFELLLEQQIQTTETHVAKLQTMIEGSNARADTLAADNTALRERVSVLEARLAKQSEIFASGGNDGDNDGAGAGAGGTALDRCSQTSVGAATPPSVETAGTTSTNLVLAACSGKIELTSQECSVNPCHTAVKMAELERKIGELKDV